MSDLKLIALDAEDLSILSAHLQDAISRVDDMAFQPQALRFVMVANRFDWASTAQRGKDAAHQRKRTGVRFERVVSAKTKGFNPKDRSTTLSLLALTFEPAEPPAGDIHLMFSGGASIQLGVECIEAELKDLGAAWTAQVPKHPGKT